MHVEWFSSSICPHPWSEQQLSGRDWWLHGEYSLVNKILAECHIHLMASKGEGNHCLTPLRKGRASIHLCLSETSWKHNTSLALKDFFFVPFWVELVLKLVSGGRTSCHGGSGSGSPWTSWISVSICPWSFTSCSRSSSLVGLHAQPGTGNTAPARGFMASAGSLLQKIMTHEACQIPPSFWNIIRYESLIKKKYNYSTDWQVSGAFFGSF